VRLCRPTERAPLDDPDANAWPPARSYVTTARNAAEAEVGVGAEADGGVDVGTLVRLWVGFDVADCTRDVHDVLRLLKASKVAATANGFMLMGQSLNQFGRRNKRTPCLASTTTTLVPARDSGWPLLHRP
jgi:hypothetical protein